MHTVSSIDDVQCRCCRLSACVHAQTSKRDRCQAEPYRNSPHALNGTHQRI
jgi:hypothetical protein